MTWEKIKISLKPLGMKSNNEYLTEVISWKWIESHLIQETRKLIRNPCAMKKN